MLTKTMMVSATILLRKTVTEFATIVHVLFVEVTGDFKVVVPGFPTRIPMVFATDSRRDSLLQAVEGAVGDMVKVAAVAAAGVFPVKVAAVVAAGVFPVKVLDLPIAIPMVFVIDSRRDSLLQAAEASDTGVVADAEEPRP